MIWIVVLLILQVLCLLTVTLINFNFTGGK